MISIMTEQEGTRRPNVFAMTALRLAATVRRVFPDGPADTDAGTSVSPRRLPLSLPGVLPVGGATLVSRASIKTYLVK